MRKPPRSPADHIRSSLPPTSTARRVSLPRGDRSSFMDAGERGLRRNEASLFGQRRKSHRPRGKWRSFDIGLALAIERHVPRPGKNLIDQGAQAAGEGGFRGEGLAELLRGHDEVRARTALS